ncbi:hypothetical protein, partial [Alistipes communis]|uniref:hypothetical protein n=1 Tax=Alistipes communis TaxID=2585118 RepID=UPI003AB5384B
MINPQFANIFFHFRHPRGTLPQEKIYPSVCEYHITNNAPSRRKLHGGRPAMRKKRPARNILPRNCIILWKTLLLHNLTDSDIMVKILWVDDEIELLKPHVLF